MGMPCPPGSPPYHALSWAWGQGNWDRLIKINGYEFYISESLHEILSHVRAGASSSNPSDGPFLLWIDALCINQANEDEKSIQVLHMRETYKDACSVIVWLGNQRERRAATGRAASFLTAHIPPIPDGLSYIAEAPSYLLNPENADVVRTICQDVLRRPWWWRMWVIQEVSLARSIVVICDGHRFSWEHLVYFSMWIRIFDIKLLCPDTQDPDDPNPYLPNITFKAMYRYKKVFNGAVELPILEVLQNASACQASNPKDMIYALLGIATDIESSSAENNQHKLVVDYKRRSVADVYIDFAKVHIHTHETNPLDVITFSRFNPNREHPLPSWVPDWSNLRETACHSLVNPTVPSAERARLVSTYYYRASGTRTAEPKITPGNSLWVTGLRFDSVSRVGVPFLGEGWKDVLQEWEALAFAGGSAMHPYLDSTQTRLDVLDRTISVDTSLEGSRLTPEQGYHRAYVGVQAGAAMLGLDFAQVVRDPGVVARELADAREVEGMAEVAGASEVCQRAQGRAFGLRLLANALEAVVKAERAAELRMLRRRFLVTGKGFFGLGPRDTEEGDVVFVLYGCSVPVVLRPDGDRWLFVGEVFVAGIMDGEVIQAADDRKFGAVVEGVSGLLLGGAEERIEIR